MPIPIWRLRLLVEPRSSQPTPTGLGGAGLSSGAQPGPVVERPGPGLERTSGWSPLLLYTSQFRREAGRKMLSGPRAMLEPPKCLLRLLPQVRPFLLLAVVVVAQ